MRSGLAARSRCRSVTPGAVLMVAVLMEAACAQTVLQQWSGIAQVPADDDFGSTIAGVGDVDGDRVPDVAIGAVDTTIGALASAGRLYVFSGADGSTIFTLDGTAAYEGFAGRVAAAGDVDGDGRADILAGSYVTPGAPDFKLVSGRTGTVIATYSNYVSAAGVGDVDADGRADLLFGRYNLVPAIPGPGLIPGPGIAHVISGRTGSILHAFAGTYPLQNFGGLVDRAGDVDGDGVQDLLIGAVGDFPWTGAFGVWVYSGSTGFLLYHKPPVGPTDSFPWAIAGVGDLDADGLDDIAVSDQGFRVQNNQSLVTTFAGPLGAQLFVASPAAPQWRIGDDLAYLGDLDGDGCDDVMTGGIQFGGGLVVFSGATQAPLLQILVTPQHVPWICAGVGDTNRDGFPDFAVGRFWDPQLQVSSVRLYSGAPPGVTTLGHGCANALGVVPRIGCTYVPARGSQFELHVTRTRAGAPAILALGTSTTAWNTVPLPLDLSSWNMPNCFLRVSVESTALASTVGNAGKGRASYALPIPNLAALAGMTFHAQWLVLEPTGSPALASLTRALNVTIQ